VTPPTTAFDLLDLDDVKCTALIGNMSSADLNLENPTTPEMESSELNDKWTADILNLDTHEYAELDSNGHLDWPDDPLPQEPKMQTKKRSHETAEHQNVIEHDDAQQDLNPRPFKC